MKKKGKIKQSDSEDLGEIVYIEDNDWSMVSAVSSCPLTLEEIQAQTSGSMMPSSEFVAKVNKEESREKSKEKYESAEATKE